MITYRIGLGFISPFFFSNMEHRVVEAAKNGWIIFKMSTLFCLYRKQEPKTIRCNIVFFEPGLFRGISKERRKEFRTMCELAGWSFVTKTRSCQLYITDTASAFDIRNDRPSTWKEILRSIKRNWLLSGLVTCLFVFLAFRISYVFTIANLLTNSALLGFIILVILPFVHEIADGCVYLYWYYKNRHWLQNEDTDNSNFVFSKHFASFYSMITIFYFLLLYLCVIVTLFSLPPDFFVVQSTPILIAVIIGKLVRTKIDYSDKDEESNMFLMFATIVLVVFTVSILSPLIDQLPQRMPKKDEVILLSDLAVDEEPDYLRNTLQKSVFTIHQVDYFESTKNHYVSTLGYRFRNKKWKSMFESNFLKSKNIFPLPAALGIKGGYLDVDKKQVYVMNDTSFYQVSSSLMLEEKQVVQIAKKLFKE